jgi:predicted dehydrogenase
MTRRIAIIGFGKIAQVAHLPAIRADSRYALAAAVSVDSVPDIGVPVYPSAAALFDAMAGRLDAVVIATPPAPRYAIACHALAAGLDVLLEKPPAATLGQLDDLARRARKSGRAIYAGWHAQHAAGVRGAAAALEGADIVALDISWSENVREFHPGQEWIWDAGGFGVFDTGINALSIATHILPEPLIVQAATLHIPANRQAPIAAQIDFAGGQRRAQFDWRSNGPPDWRITVVTGKGQKVELCNGGATLLIDGNRMECGAPSGYPSIYDEFAMLCNSGTVAIDAEPLRVVADAFLVAGREQVAPFA